MSNVIEIFGAKAIIYLKYKGEMETLTDKLSSWLNLPKFYFDTDQDPPHDIFASCEVLGFDVFLIKSSILAGFRFELTLQTKHSSFEIFNDQMHDLSMWLARFISKIYQIDSLVINKNRTGILFVNGELMDSNIPY